MSKFSEALVWALKEYKRFAYDELRWGLTERENKLLAIRRRRACAELEYGFGRELANKGFDVDDIRIDSNAIEYFDRIGGVRKGAADNEAQLLLDCRALEGWSDISYNDLVDIAGEAFIDAANDINYLVTADDVFAQLDDTWWCDYNGERYSDNVSSYEVVTRLRPYTTETWCEDAVNNSAFWCDTSDIYYSDAGFSRDETDDGYTICGEWARENGWYWHEDAYVWAEHPEYDDDDDDDDEDSGHVNIPSYHSARRDWSYAQADRATRGYYGLEIEVLFDSSADRGAAYEGAVDQINIAAERDGSLHEQRGLEFITRPIAFDEFKGDNCLRALCAVLTDQGATAPAGYGVHVNTNTGRLSRDHVDRLEDAIVANRSMSEFVARRKHAHMYKYVKNTGSDGKYVAFNRRNASASEIRIFQGTPNYDVIMEYVEYVEALTEWTRNPARPTAGPTMCTAFRRWVRQSNDYPNLARRFGGALNTMTTDSQPMLRRAA